VLGRPAGAGVDRFGRVPVTLAGAVVCTAFVASLGFAGGPVVLAALWTVAGAGSSLVWAGLNVLTVEAVPGNRAGGTSVVGAFKFAGQALAPVLWLPLYHADVRLGFAGAAVMAALSGAFILPLRRPARL
jgi:MFS family permease